ncbi:DNA primase [Sphingomonas solaris]|uniref:DNA primase n=1 Tax=Alterirhizorhabdus solaris TaxID=2529389 RepID=A0A558QYG1_9SPHN|nr:DNA primase [Sphingomonas solaris]TVV72204.1 DNA primase [Sphingomonas solaris]
MMLSPAFLDELRARTSLSALIGRTVKITKAGREFKACCPFHQEKTPSFYINDDKGFYHCFGCSAHGDAIRFLTEAQGLPFIEAVKELAQAAGLEMPAPDRQSQERAEQAATLIGATEAAADWFRAQLGGIEGAAARAYLDRRGVSPALRDAFGLGFAPDSRGKLKTALDRFGVPMLVEAGLLIEVDGREPYDRFRGRLMIPIRDARGRSIAFGGRILDAGEPKYLNSPETPLFDKGRTLFNLDRAAPASRKADRLFVVEGYMDVIGLASAGIDEAVAPLGTALTEQQMGRLWRLIDVPTLCFDGDAAGQKAAVRAAERALPALTIGKSLRFPQLPKGQDPDDIVKAGGVAAWEQAVAAPAPLVSLLYKAEAAKIDAASPEARAQLRQRLSGLADSCADKLVAEEYRRSFTSLFFEDFGWKRQERGQLNQAVVGTGPHGRKELSGLYIRSVLYGLTRYPKITVDRLETVGSLRVDHDEFRRWRDVLMHVAITRPDLDTDGIEAILATEALTDTARFDVKFDLRFPFTRPGADAAFAVERLIAMIEMISEERDLDDEMARLNAVALADTGLGRYEAIEAARQRNRERKLLLRERGYELGSIDMAQAAELAAAEVAATTATGGI